MAECTITDYCALEETPIPAQFEALECREECLTYPMCQIGGVVYRDSNLSGYFDQGDDAINSDGQIVNYQDGADKLNEFKYHPDFATCFYNSAPSMFGKLDDLKQKHGIWPPHFTVIASIEGSTATTWEEDIVANLYRDLDRELKTVHAQKSGINFYWNWVDGDSTWDPLVQRRSFVGKKQGWRIDEQVCGEITEKRYIISICAFPDASVIDTVEHYEDGVRDLAGLYGVTEDRIEFIRSSLWDHLDAETIKEIFKKVVNKIGDSKKGEVMVIYYAHGDDLGVEWRTKLHEGLFYNTYIFEKEFRKLFIEGLPEKKISSVLLLVHSCHSGMLVE